MRTSPGYLAARALAFRQFRFRPVVEREPIGWAQKVAEAPAISAPDSEAARGKDAG
jgi:hypothetical protein